MNYTDLKATITRTVENEFTEAQLATFTRQAEQKIFQAVSFPALRQSATVQTTDNVANLNTPIAMLNVRSVAVTDGGYSYLLQKDSGFIREAFPSPTAKGRPAYYGFLDVDAFILGPTPDDAYNVEIEYEAYPESIVTAGTTWLGDAFDTALLNGSLVEALRFIKGEEAQVRLYMEMYMEALTLLKNLGDKIKQDGYRPAGGMRG